VGFTAITLIAVAMGVSAFVELREIHTQCSLVKQQALPSIYRAGELTENVYAIGSRNDDLLLKLLMASDADLKKSFKDQLAKNQASLLSEIDQFGGALVDAQSRRLFIQVKTAAQGYATLVNKIIALSDGDNPLDAMQMKQNELGAAFTPLAAAVHAEVVQNRDAGNAAGEGIESAVNTGEQIVQLCLVCFAVVAPIAALIALGATPKLKRMAQSLAQTAKELTAASGQVAALGRTLAAGAAVQTTGLDETTARLEAMTTMTRNNADSAAQASRVFDEIKAAAYRTVDSMSQMRGAIEQIQASAAETCNIIGTIDEISLQTRRLALTAATESARSAKDGKSFADVIKGIRELAMRTADSARGTKSLVKANMESATMGLEISREVDGRLNAIQQSVIQAGTKFSEITVATQEQSAGIGQIRVAVQGISQVTQSNAASARAFTASADALKDQAACLQGAIGELQLLAGNAIVPVEKVRPVRVDFAKKIQTANAQTPKLERPKLQTPKLQTSRRAAA
jgi:methyl-accepting chemotaxis protein